MGYKDRIETREELRIQNNRLRYRIRVLEEQLKIYKTMVAELNRQNKKIKGSRYRPFNWREYAKVG